MEGRKNGKDGERNFQLRRNGKKGERNEKVGREKKRARKNEDKRVERRTQTTFCKNKQKRNEWSSSKSHVTHLSLSLSRTLSLSLSSSFLLFLGWEIIISISPSHHFFSFSPFHSHNRDKKNCSCNHSWKEFLPGFRCLTRSWNVIAVTIHFFLPFCSLLVAQQFSFSLTILLWWLLSLSLSLLDYTSLVSFLSLSLSLTILRW